VGIVEKGAKPGTITLAPTLGYGFTEPQPAEPGAHHRMSGRLAASEVLASWLAAALVLDGRYDLHPDDGQGRDDGWVFDAHLALRSGTTLGAISLGTEVVATLPGSESIATSFKGTSLDAKVLLGAVGENLTIGTFAGFRYDRSAEVGMHASELRFGDRLALGLSDFNGVLGGAGAAYRTGNTMAFAELSTDWLVGAGAPPFRQSPAWTTLGLREFLTTALSVEGAADVALGSRPPVSPTAPLVPVEPRFSAQLGLRYRFGQGSAPALMPATPSPVAPARRVAEPPKAPETEIEVGITDDVGIPLKEAKVQVEVGGKTVPLEPDEKGRYRASRVPLGPGKLTVEARGRKKVEQRIDLNSRTPLKLEIRTDADLPSGQVRGLIRSFDGKPIAAKITVEPGGAQTHTDDQGFFQIDVPPGSYQILVEARGFHAQRRSVQVEKDGVLILNADLSRGH
jgi:hypothetical protein